VWQPAGTAGSRRFKFFDYYSATDPVGRRGRLKTSVRYNYFSDPSRTGGLPTINVATTHAYSTCTGSTTQCTGLLASETTTVSVPAANGSPAQAFFGGTVGYQYDPRGEVSRVDYPVVNGAPPRSINYAYTNGYLTSVKDGSAARATISYYLNGLTKKVQLAASGVADNITADVSGIMRPGKIDWQWTGGASSTGAYSYDGAGNISAMGGDSFKYDRAMRLVRATVAGQTQTYTYDGFGNITNLGGRAVSVDWKANRVNAPFVYDDGGNLTEIPDAGAANGKLTFAFDPLNLMTTVDGQRLGRAFVYDAADERVGIIDYKATGGRRELWSIRDQQQRVLRDFERTFTAAGAAQWQWTKDYVYRGDSLSNTVSPSAGGGQAVRDIHVDHLGSVRFVTDANGQIVTGAAGATSSGTRYWPYGAMVFKRLLDERLAFTGHERDDDGTTADEADFDNMHARYFTPAFGRFFSLDPGGMDPLDPRAWNRYSYALCNPLIGVDPDGRETQLVVGRNTAQNPFGHVAIAINGRVYSFGTNWSERSSTKRDWGISLQAYLAPQNNLRETNIVTLKVTPQQEQALQAHLESHNPNAAGAPGYGELSNSCVTVAENALDTVGILPNQPGPVVIDRAGNEMQAGAPASMTPDGLLQQTQSAGLVESSRVVGRAPEESTLRVWWNAIMSKLR
jgi:RHS repeat-associated protein